MSHRYAPFAVFHAMEGQRFEAVEVLKLLNVRKVKPHDLACIVSLCGPNLRDLAVEGQRCVMSGVSAPGSRHTLTRIITLVYAHMQCACG